MVKKIKAYQEALQKCQRKELWFLKEDESVYGARESTYSPSDVCENCNLYSAQGKYEDYGDIASGKGGTFAIIAVVSVLLIGSVVVVKKRLSKKVKR